MIRFLDWLTWGLGVFCGVLLLTGGYILKLPHAKIEFSSLDPWMWTWLLLLGIRWQVAQRQAAPIWTWLSKKIQWIVFDSDRSKRFADGVFILGALSIGLAHVFKHYGGYTYFFDVTFVHQAIYQAFSSPILHCDLCDGATYLGEHLAWTFLFLAPIASLFKSWVGRDLFIFIFQSVFILGSAYWVLLSVFRSKISGTGMLFVAAIVMMAHRAVRGNLLWDFREDHIAFGALMLAAMALFRSKQWMYFFCIALAAFSKENVAMVLPFFVAPIFLERELTFSFRQRIFLAMITVFFSVVWVIISFRWIIPYFNPHPGTNEIAVRLAEFGATPAEVLKNVLFSPLAWLKLLLSVFSKSSVKYLILLIMPWIFFVRRAWVWFIPALPGIAMNLLSSSENQRSLYFHYEAIIIPFLLIGAWLGIRRTPMHQWMMGLMLAIAFSGRWPGHYLQEYWPESDRWEENLFLQNQRSQKGDIVAAFPFALAHLSQMPELRMIRSDASCDRMSAEDYLLLQQKPDMTQLPWHSPFEAKIWVVDQKDACSKHIEKFALKNEWKVRSISPQGRWKIWERTVVGL